MRRLHTKDLNTPEFHNHVWTLESIHRFDRVRQRELTRRAKDGMRVIDLGAGLFGPAQYLVQETNLDLELVAVDFSDKARQIALNMLWQMVPQRAAHFNFVLSRAERTLFLSDSFDLVVAGELIEHYEDPSILVKEMARLCRPGGWLAISTVDTQCEDAIRHGDYPEHLWSFDPEDLLKYFSPFGKAEFRTVGDYQMIECQITLGSSETL